MDPSKYIRYSDAIEHVEPSEQVAIDGIIEAMTGQSQTVAHRMNGHAVRASHAKSTGLLTGILEIPSNPPPLAQGLFAKLGTHDVAIRFAQGPGEVLNDRVSTHRGMAIKVFDVDGGKLSGHTSNTQDFVLASGPTFPSGTAERFLRDEKLLQTATPLPEILKSSVSAVARAAASASQMVLGKPSPQADFFGHPFSHPLSEPYYSQAPSRFGDYVAKIAAFPVSGAQLDRLQKVQIDTSKDEDAFRTAVVSHFATEPYTFEIRVQLWNQKDSQPIEDAAVEWSQEESPFETVAKLSIPQQAAYSAQRQKYFDEAMSFRPGHSLLAHRPLGSVMRARLQVYPALSAFRQKTNGVTIEEPEKVEQIPK